MDKLRQGSFRRGCVWYAVQLSVEQAVRLISYVQKYGGRVRLGDPPADAPEEVLLYIAFLKENNVTEIRDVHFDKAISTSKTKATHPMVVFAHGWNSNPKSAFGELPELLTKLTGLRTYCYGYPSGSSGLSSLISVATHMDNEIAKETRGSEVLVIIGHSMGGLLARRLLVAQHSDNALENKSVRQLTLMASPSVGSGLAKVGDILTLFSNNQLEDLRQDSRFMEDLGPRWASWQRRYVPTQTKVRAIYGEKDKVVPRSEAVLFDPKPVLIFGADHSTVVNPRDDDSRMRLATTLRLFIEQAGVV